MHPFTRSTGALVAAAVLVTGTLAESGVAQAQVTPRAVVAGGLVSPLTAGVRPNGTAYVSENFAGILAKIRPGHKPKAVFHAKKGVEVGGVTADASKVTFTLTVQGKGMTSQHSFVMHRSAGKVTRFANTGAFERNKNPDAGVTYGFRHLNKTCLSKVPKQIPARYTGIVDTHAYSTATTGGTTYVGDAAGNDILSIDSGGHISLVTLLPPVPLLVTKHRAQANKLPPCTVGHRYWFEPVPTDVEVTASGELVVTALTGATEAPGFGGRRASTGSTRTPSRSPWWPRTSTERWAWPSAPTATTSSPSSSATWCRGSTQAPGGLSHYRSVTQPAAVERAGGKVYVTSQVLAQKPIGRLLRFPS